MSRIQLILSSFAVAAFCMVLPGCHPSEKAAQTTSADTTKKNHIHTNGPVQKQTMTGPAPSGGQNGSRPK